MTDVRDIERAIPAATTGLHLGPCWRPPAAGVRSNCPTSGTVLLALINCRDLDTLRHPNAGHTPSRFERLAESLVGLFDFRVGLVRCRDPLHLGAEQSWETDSL